MSKLLQSLFQDVMVCGQKRSVSAPSISSKPRESELEESTQKTKQQKNQAISTSNEYKVCSQTLEEKVAKHEMMEKMKLQLDTTYSR